MPHFTYTGLTRAGAKTSGELHAEGRKQACESLRNQGIRVVTLNSKAQWVSSLMQKPVRLKDLARFTRDFATMVRAGIPLAQCLDILAQQTESSRLASAIRSISSDILGGKALADAFRDHPKLFSPLYCNMIAAGEASGSLGVVLQRLCEYQEKSVALRRKVTGALAYPLAILVVTVAATLLMFGYVVPQFSALFAEFGARLPLATQVVFSMSAVVKRYALYIGAGVVAAILGARWYGRTDNGAMLYDRIALRIPVIGSMLQKSAVARFGHTMSTLLSSGVGILDALAIAANTAGNKVIARGVLLSLEKIAGGEEIAEPLRKAGVFPPMVIRMIAVGEQTGELDSMLGSVAQVYDDEVDTAVGAITAVLEPLMIVFMAVIIGAILVSMYLPMFDIFSTIGQ